MFDDRQFTVGIDTEGVEAGVAFLSLFVRLLSDVQSAFLQIGDYHHRGSGVRDKGAFPAEVARSCQLLITGTFPGSLNARLAPVPSERLFQDFDLGLKSRETFLTLTKASATSGFSAVAQEVIADDTARTRIVRTMRAFCPRKEDGYKVRVDAPGWHPVILDGRVQERFEVVLAEPSKEDRAAVGRLVKLSLIPTSLSFLIDQGPHKKVSCDYGPELIGAVAGAAGKYVEVRGTAELDREGQVSKFLEVRDLLTLDASPTWLSKVEGKTGTVVFRHPLKFLPDYQKDLAVLNNADLGIMAVGHSKAECLANLARELVVLWHEIALARDEELTSDAMALKNKLRAAVLEVSQ